MSSFHWHPLRRAQDFIRSEAAGGVVLMVAAASALIVANSPLSDSYTSLLQSYLGPLSVLHWINDGLMAIFFLLVGLEIKRETLDGELSTWSKRVLPGLCAIGGMVVPALIYLSFNLDSPDAIRGWAIPTATDIAFALGVLSLLGPRVPVSLKVFLTALAIIDDLGAVIIIALFYTDSLRLAALIGAAAVVVALIGLNRFRVRVIWPYLLLGLVLWWLVLLSGVHATLAGVALALTLPLDATGDQRTDADEDHSPLLRVEHALHRVVPFLIIPVFGFANAGLSFAGIGWEQVVAPLTLGVAAGLLFGKLVGVLGVAWIAVHFGVARLPAGTGWAQMAGVAALCGIGFTMSLFIGMLAFAQSPVLQEEVKLGILSGSLIAGLVGALLLALSSRPTPRPTPRED
ncbi:Na+/H+ antiporter NhaA [Chiayiivirga sp.]|jgi:NhaA family Na+:H+ antiporter|uniref:Na+/H+ antiporter NhaA n=1 Tax=Chiayiivirga sp. TaxID=2041042 RepID=UPI003DA9AF61